MRRSEFALVLAVAGVVAYAPALLFAQRGVKAAFQYFAADAFYYLAVARHSAQAGFFTFDGRFPTNGFHPLWQYGLTLIFRSAALGDQKTQILAVFILGVALVALGSGLFAAALLRLTRNAPVALLAAVPGFYYLLFSIVEPNFGSPWAFANGMETPLSVLLIGALVYLVIGYKLLSQQTGARVAMLSALLTLITLARLDDVFIFAPFLALIYVRANSLQDKARSLAIACGIPAVAIGGFLAYNFSYAGAAMPVSGLAKGSLALPGNTILAILTLIPAMQFGNLWIGTWQATAWRALQLLAPVIAATAGLWRFGGRRTLKTDFWRSPEPEPLVAVLCAYVLLKGAYNLVNVSLGSQGHWYFAGSLMVASLVAARIIAPATSLAGQPRATRFATAAAVMFVLLVANAFTDRKRLSDYNASFYEFWTQRGETEAGLRRVADGAGIVELDDGILAYSLNIPAMSGLGFALDLEAHRARQAGALLPLAYARGFRLLASLNYFSVPAGAELDSEQLRQILAGPYFLSNENLDRWVFRVVYREPVTGTAFIRFDPVQ